MRYKRETLIKALREWAEDNENEPFDPMPASASDLEEIWKALPEQHGFYSTRELRNYLFEVSYSYSVECTDKYDEYVEAHGEVAGVAFDDLAATFNIDPVVDALEHGKEYAYESVLGIVGGELSGPGMWSRALPLDDSTGLFFDGDFLRISGKISAPWHLGALNKIAQGVSMLIGASLSLGLGVRRETEALKGLDLPTLLSITEETGNEAAMRQERYDRELKHLVLCTTFAGKENQSEWDRGIAKREGILGLRDSWFRPLVNLWNDQTQRGRELWHSCEVFSRAHASWKPAETVFLCVMCLEGLLLPSYVTDESIGRLSEAVAFSLGRNPEERQNLRDLVKQLYAVRSKYVHQGGWTGYDFKNPGQRQKFLKDEEDVETKALDLAGRALRREILSTYHELSSVSRNRKG